MSSDSRSSKSYSGDSGSDDDRRLSHRNYVHSRTRSYSPGRHSKRRHSRDRSHSRRSHSGRRHSRRSHSGRRHSRRSYSGRRHSRRRSHSRHRHRSHRRRSYSRSISDSRSKSRSHRHREYSRDYSPHHNSHYRHESHSNDRRRVDDSTTSLTRDNRERDDLNVLPDLDKKSRFDSVQVRDERKARIWKKIKLFFSSNGNFIPEVDLSQPEDIPPKNALDYVYDDEELLRDFETAANEDQEDPLDAYMATLEIPKALEPKNISVSWEDIQSMGEIYNGESHDQPDEQADDYMDCDDQVDSTETGGQELNSMDSEHLFIKMLKMPLEEDKLDKSDDEDDKKLMEIHRQSKLQFYTEIAGKVRLQKKLEPMDPVTAASLPEFRKDFYVECKEIASLADHEVSSIRKTNGNIKVRGKGCPRPIINFAQCGLPDEILKILEGRDYENPFPVQMQCIPVLMSGRDLVGVAQTGSGKTLAYLLPLIRHVMAQPKLLIGDGCIALVIVPTRELAVQINREAIKFAKHLKLVSTAVYGGTGIGDQLNALKRGSHIVVGTPGRLIDVLTISNGKVTNLKRTTFIVLDEADRMFDLGFAPQVQTIIDNTRPDRQTCLFSATFPSAIEMLAKRILTNPIEVTVGKKGAGANKVEQHVLVVKDEKEKLFKLLKLLGEWYEYGKIIIFVNKQLEADNLFMTLLKYGYHSYTLHGGQDQTDRTFTLQDFKDPRIRNGILISTSVASRGLDVKQVVLVINYNTPGHLEDYIHRVGRTGRAGNVGVAYTLVLPSDAPKTPDIVKALEYSNQPVPHELQALCDSHLVNTESNMNIPMNNDKTVSAEVKRRKPKTTGGFGGKGYKFDQSELSLQQRQRKEATKVIDEDLTEEEKARLKEEMEPEPIKPVKSAPPKHYNSGPDPTTLYLNANTSTGGIIVDEFQINKYSEAVRSKVTNREVLLRIAEDTGTRLQVKGHFLNQNAQNTIVYSGFVTSTFGLKPLYVEINGPSPIHIQRAKIELKNLIDAINETAPPTIPQFRTPGKYSVL